MRHALLLALSLSACAGSSDDEPAVSACGETAPTFTTVDVTDAGTRTVGGEEVRFIEVSAQTDDVDGDLHRYSVHIWWDTLPDGELASEPEVTLDDQQLSPTECGVDDAKVGALLALGPSEVPFGTQIEIGFVAFDAALNPTNGGDPVIVEFETPVE